MEQGGAVRITGGATVGIDASVFESNRATKGGAIYVGGNAFAEVFFTKFEKNGADRGAAMFVSGHGTVVLRNQTSSLPHLGEYGTDDLVNLARTQGRQRQQSKCSAVRSAVGARFSPDREAIT